MVSSSWWADGTIAGYDPVEAYLVPDTYSLVAGGSVPLQGITRLQYNIAPWPNQITAAAKIKVGWDDYYVAASGSRKIGATMYVVPAQTFSSEFGAAYPSPADIRRYSQIYGFPAFRSTNTVPTSGGVPVGGTTNYTFDIPGPYGQDLQPNTLYWVAVLPASRVDAQNPNLDAPLYTDPSFALGRAVSLWTNRTPAAPVITSPPTNTLTTSATSLTLSISNPDPDNVGGGGPAYTDLAGIQVQYAARATPGNPSPPWTDMSFADSSGTLRKGWWIEDSNSNVAGEALETFRNNRTIQIRCGSSTPVASQGLLPGGEWQVRVRVFDFGQPQPAGLFGVRPFAKPNGYFTVADAPASNTSPWSTPVIISVTSQVPPPIPLSPINHNAIPFGSPVTLLWQYRNAAAPPTGPFAQASRTVQIRQVGSLSWTTLASGSSSLKTLYVNPGVYPLPVSTEHEWRVQVTDTDGTTSNFSEVGRFWIVPAPGSGVVRPLPGDATDGATLGCGTHRVFVYRRGGKVRVGELRQITHVDWSRVRDDISDAQVDIQGWDIDNGNLLAKLQTWAYEIVIIRDNGASSDRVWEGPIVRLTYEADKVTIHAKDMMGYAYRRIIKQQMTDSKLGDTVTSRAARVLQNAFAADDPNVLSYLTVLARPDDSMQYRSTPAYSRTAFEEVDDMAANAGLDYTAVGRSILLWGTHHRIGTLPEFRDTDLGATPIVSEYGMSFANRYGVSDGNGVWGEAVRLDLSGNDPTYGIVEMLSSTWASDAEPESESYTETGLATVIASFTGFAQRSIASRYPPPVIVRIPDNTTLNPDAVVSIQSLVPGVLIPLRSTGTLRDVVASQKLDSVNVTEEAGKEEITITLSPFSSDDADTGEGDGG